MGVTLREKMSMKIIVQRRVLNPRRVRRRRKVTT